MITRWKFALILSVAVVTAVQSENSTENQKNPSEKSDFKKSSFRDCASKYTPTCLKFDIVSWVDKLNEQENLDILPGLSLVRENGTSQANTAEIVAELARSFPNDVESRLDAFLLKKVTGYLNSHSIRLKIFGNEAESAEKGTARGGGGGGYGGGGGGGGKKGGGMGGVLLAGAAMMKGTLMAIGMGALAALAGKALMTGLISLLLSAIIGLKSLSHGGGKTTYEVIAKPIYTHANTHSVSHEDHHHGGYSSYGHGRSLDVPLPIGLQPEYKP